MIDELAVEIEHIIIAEIPVFGGEPQNLKRPVGNLDIIDSLCNDFKQTCLKHDVGIEFVNLSSNFLCLFEESGIVDGVFPSPAVNCPTDEFWFDVADQTEIIVSSRIGSVGSEIIMFEHGGHRDRVFQIIFQYGTGNAVRIELVIGTGFHTQADGTDEEQGNARAKECFHGMC